MDSVFRWDLPGVIDRKFELPKEEPISLDANLSLTLGGSNTLRIKHQLTWFISDSRTLAVIVYDPNLCVNLRQLAHRSGKERDHVYLITEVLHLQTSEEWPLNSCLQDVSWYYTTIFVSWLKANPHPQTAMWPMEYAILELLHRLQRSKLDESLTWMSRIQSGIQTTLEAVSPGYDVVEVMCKDLEPILIKDINDISKADLKFDVIISWKFDIESVAISKGLVTIPDIQTLPVLRSRFHGSESLQCVLVDNRAIRLRLSGHKLSWFMFGRSAYVYVDDKRFGFIPNEFSILPWNIGYVRSPRILRVDESAALNYLYNSELKTRLFEQCIRMQPTLDAATRSDDDTNSNHTRKSKTDNEDTERNGSTLVESAIYHALHTLIQLELRSYNVRESLGIVSITPEQDRMTIQIRDNDGLKKIVWFNLFQLYRTYADGKKKFTTFLEYLVRVPDSID